MNEVMTREIEALLDDDEQLLDSFALKQVTAGGCVLGAGVHSRELCPVLLAQAGLAASSPIGDCLCIPRRRKKWRASFRYKIFGTSPNHFSFGGCMR